MENIKVLLLDGNFMSVLHKCYAGKVFHAVVAYLILIHQLDHEDLVDFCSYLK